MEIRASTLWLLLFATFMVATGTATCLPRDRQGGAVATRNLEGAYQRIATAIDKNRVDDIRSFFGESLKWTDVDTYVPKGKEAYLGFLKVLATAGPPVRHKYHVNVRSLHGMHAEVYVSEFVEWKPVHRRTGRVVPTLKANSVATWELKGKYPVCLSIVDMKREAVLPSGRIVHQFRRK